MTEVKRLIKYYLLGESLKEIEMNKILDKISRKKVLTSREKNFLELYNHTSEDDTRDYMLLSKNVAYKRVKQLLDNNKKVICDLHYRDGKIGIQIIDMQNDFERDFSEIKLKDGMILKLEDKFLYNIIYNIKKNLYSLTEQDEYFEKIEHLND
jgi:DNA invertase Pin-like site-specific DNA recombinase